MGYELENIESVVGKVLSLILSANFKADEFQRIKDFFSSEFRRITTAFRRKVVSGEREPNFKHYFAAHQIGLIEILDHIFETNSTIQNHKDNYSFIIEYLLETTENLLTFIKTQFPDYFNTNVTAPKYFIEKAKQDLAGRMDALQLIRSNQYIEAELINPVLSIFEQALAQDNNPLTFRQLRYLKLLQEEIYQIDLTNGDNNWRRSNLCNALIKLNFNDPQFFKFFTGYISNVLLTCETLSDCIDKAGYFHKIINQVTVIQGVGLVDSDMDVKYQLLEWLVFELDYLHQKQQLQLSSKETDLIKKDFKIIFDLSVSQLGYLFKIFIETGIIQNKNTSELIRFLAKFVKTKKAESVSYESLRIKFYNSESGIKDAVKKLFQSLLNYIH